VQICTSIDGPPAIHDRQRRLPGGSAFHAAQRWVRHINEAYQKAGLDPEVYHVEGLLTVTRDALEQPEAIVDTYADLGFRALSLRPLDPFGFASKTARVLGYSAEEYLAFHRRVLEHMLQLNRRGTRILERYASIFLTKILSDDDPNFLDLRSPCGAGIGQVAYGHNGAIFTCDEGRMLGNMGDEFFRIGTIGETSYREAIGHETVRSLTVASNVYASPDCVECVYNPYCGLCPVHNYAVQGTLHGQMRNSFWCKTMMGIQDYVFTLLKQNDPEVLPILRQWITVRSRTHYRHQSEPLV
jgi:radical SAM protein with 4Fe4S-binding SPASM domain